MERLQVSASNVMEEVFCLSLGTNTDVTGLLWTYNIPVLASGEKKFILEFETVTAQALGYIGNDFPSSLRILCTNAAGYKDSTGSPTTCVVVLAPSSITSCGTPALQQWVVLYSMTGKDVAWELGVNRIISFQLVDDSNSPIALPLSNPINAVFRILHISM